MTLTDAIANELFSMAFTDSIAGSNTIGYPPVMLSLMNFFSGLLPIASLEAIPSVIQLRKYDFN